MESERRNGYPQIHGTLARLEERMTHVQGDMAEIKKDVKSLRMWVNIGRGIMTAAVVLGGWIGFNGWKHGS